MHRHIQWHARTQPNTLFYHLKHIVYQSQSPLLFVLILARGHCSLSYFPFLVSAIYFFASLTDCQNNLSRFSCWFWVQTYCWFWSHCLQDRFLLSTPIVSVGINVSLLSCKIARVHCFREWQIKRQLLFDKTMHCVKIHHVATTVTTRGPAWAKKRNGVVKDFKCTHEPSRDKWWGFLEDKTSWCPVAGCPRWVLVYYYIK